MTQEDKCVHAKSLCEQAEIKFTEMDRRITDHFIADDRLIENRFRALAAQIVQAEITLGKWQREHNDFRKEIQRERLDYATRLEMKHQRRETFYANAVSSIVVALIVAFLVATFIKP